MDFTGANFDGFLMKGWLMVKRLRQRIVLCRSGIWDEFRFWVKSASAFVEHAVRQLNKLCDNVLCCLHVSERSHYSVWSHTINYVQLEVYVYLNHWRKHQRSCCWRRLIDCFRLYWTNVDHNFDPGCNWFDPNSLQTFIFDQLTESPNRLSHLALNYATNRQ